MIFRHQFIQPFGSDLEVCLKLCKRNRHVFESNKPDRKYKNASNIPDLAKNDYAWDLYNELNKQDAAKIGYIKIEFPTLSSDGGRWYVETGPTDRLLKCVQTLKMGIVWSLRRHFEDIPETIRILTRTIPYGYVEDTAFKMVMQNRHPSLDRIRQDLFLFKLRATKAENSWDGRWIVEDGNDRAA